MKSKKILACTLAITTTVCSSMPAFAGKVDAIGPLGLISDDTAESSSLGSSRILKATMVARNISESVVFASTLTQGFQQLGRDARIKFGFRRSGIPKMTDGKMRETIKKLDTELSCIEGQDEAIEKVKRQVKSILIKRSTDENKGVDILYLIGPPGVGKSETAKLVANALLPKGRKAFSINESAVSGEEEKSLATQLFSRQSMSHGGYDFDNNSSYNSNESDLLKMLRINSNTVLIIDEYDKIMTKCEDAEALLRSLHDNAEVVYNGEKIDCRGLVVIITSNEKGESADLPEHSPGEKVLGEYGRTNIKREESILDRLNRVEFKGLDDDALTKIAKVKITKEISAYQKKFGIDIKIADSVYRTLIEKAKKEYAVNGSARLIDNRLLVNLRNGLVNLIASDETIKEKKERSFPASLFCICIHHKEQKETRCIEASLDCGGNWVFENKLQCIEVKVEGSLDEEAVSSTVADTVVLRNSEVSTSADNCLENEVSSETSDKDSKSVSEDKKETNSGKRTLEAKVEMIEEKEESSESDDKALETDSEDKEERASGKRPLRAIVQMIEEKDY